ncbi:hypothetical protein CLDAP_23160 [Caldilinea aerophila DSM 14535 = NBRC 104270]|uniref:Uncharacterized protein n=1 Tax=Caldilinea aerophila (strain DSM 14535 / JCM 11387 / NBRC 104270 / STL-6-O1) TaxID=926550 RepID=I0I518_CALAS|nr:hypothetical protein CLDAP_23160 [Caldilinea aerophila DSM 14535 = NBRC 104270]
MQFAQVKSETARLESGVKQCAQTLDQLAQIERFAAHLLTQPHQLCLGQFAT